MSFRWGVLAVVLLVSCSPQVRSPSVVEPGAFPVTLVHEFGTTTLTSVPRRVVTWGLVEQDAFLALGLVPIATRQWFGDAPGGVFPWAQPLLRDAPLPERLDNALDAEHLKSLHPDLITALYSQLSASERESVEAIAPTVGPSPGYPAWGVPWQEITRRVAHIVGRPVEGERLVAAVDQVFRDERRDHPEFEGQSAVIVSSYGWPQRFSVYSSHDARGRFLQDLGFRLPSVVDERAGADFGAVFEYDELALFGTSVVVWLTESVAQADQIGADPLWRSTEAAHKGRSIFLPAGDPYYDALNFVSVLSLPYTVAGMVPRLEGALRAETP